MVIRRLLTRLLELFPEESVPEAPAAAEEAHPASAAANLPSCKAVVLSDRAVSVIVSHTLAHDPEETGGILLGWQKEGVCYVVEATDAGPKAFHSPHHMEMNEEYQNHVYPMLHGVYRHGVDLLGLWHRHPGSYDRFSATDLATNAAYARSIGESTISMLVNLDPDLRVSCFFCRLNEAGGLDICRVPVLVGDRHFKDPELLEPAYPARLPAPVTDAPLSYPIS